MAETDRRKFLAVAGGGAAAGVVGIAVPASASATRDANSAQQTVVAYVEDHRSSKVRLMLGEREVVVHDRDLVTRILNAAGGE